MSKMQTSMGDNPSDNLICTHCNAILPSKAESCRACGKQVTTKNEELESDATNSNNSSQAQESDSPIQDVEEGETESTALHEAPIQIDPVQSLPTSLAQPTSKTSKQASIHSNLLWPIILILSAIAAGLANFAFSHMALRPFIVFWFLFICPGMALVRFLRLKEPVIELTLAVALSFAFEASIAAIQLYTGRWSPAGTLGILILLCLCGATVQLAIIYLFPQFLWGVAVCQLNKVFRPVGVVLKLYLINPLYEGFSKIVSNKTTPSLPKLPRIIPARNFYVLILLTLFITMIVGVSFRSYEVFHGSHSATSPSPLPYKDTPHLSPTSTVVPTPSTSSAHIAALYNGTIYDISANVTTTMSLTGIQQAQMTIGGNFTGLHKTGTFNGIINPHLPKHIQFTVKDTAGHLILSFDGYIQADGELSGSYCNLDQNARCTGNYGIWSVTPV
jgi:ribosomal protein L40E